MVLMDEELDSHEIHDAAAEHHSPENWMRPEKSNICSWNRGAGSRVGALGIEPKGYEL